MRSNTLRIGALEVIGSSLVWLMNGKVTGGVQRWQRGTSGIRGMGGMGVASATDGPSGGFSRCFTLKTASTVCCAMLRDVTFMLHCSNG